MTFRQDHWDCGGSLDGLLAGYALGALPRPVRRLVDAHLEMKPQAREFVHGLECLCSAKMEKAPPAALSNRETMLSAILAAEPAARPCCKAKAHGIEASLPRALTSYVGVPLDALRWRRILPGLKEARLPEEDGCSVSLMQIRAGTKVPQHTHEGQEITLVLKGAFADETGRYGAGDIAIGDEALDHRPIVPQDEDCLCFIVIDGRLRLTGPVGGLVSRFFG
ncbi:MAG: ChrR family anti-sigma-E factor [Hyphomicrobiaceae bacterium]|nr:ChrR family anti-sigma-E factor [Hyphomicrobiaceae bacterium]